jgi:HSP90 family molecular chaperone
MPKQTRFQVDSRLASLLSQEYSSTEKALKELVDNAWDADAKHIFISLPSPMSSDPIIIRDDGSGMTSEEVERHYLKIAADRRLLRGVRTPVLNRLVKGRKGVGKFAGLMAASRMKLETASGGLVTSFELELNHLNTVVDIEHLPISLKVETCDARLNGTTITLSNLHSGFAYPDATKFKQILLQEYGRERDISIRIDGKTLGIDDVVGLLS